MKSESEVFDLLFVRENLDVLREIQHYIFYPYIYGISNTHEIFKQCFEVCVTRFYGAAQCYSGLEDS